MIQVYTSFGYRGVGTPRLLKDEISTSLIHNRSTWKSEIGKEWMNKGVKEMGWDEKREEERLKKESEDVKSEAEDLAKLLKGLDDREATARLIKEVEEALKGSRGVQVVDGQGPRDNLLGASEEPSRVDPLQTQNMLEDALAQQVVESAAQGERQRDLDQAIPTPSISSVVAETEVDPWTRQVRTGQRRLV
jgi:dihydroorotate dehydrogenase